MKTKTIKTLQQQVLEIKPNENIAIKCLDSQLTYRQIISISDKIANRLTHDLGKQNSKIIVWVKPDENYVTILLSIAKAGMTFIPVAHDTPKNRFDTIVNIVNPDLIINDNNILDYINDNHEYKEDFYQAAPEDPQWIVFTSGSSGTPKGVIRTQRNNGHCCKYIWEKQFLDIFNKCKAIEILLNLCSFGGVHRIFLSLIYGKTNILINQSNIVESAINNCQNDEVGIFTTPSLFNQVIKHKNFDNCIESMRFVVFCGEPISIVDTDTLFAKISSNVALINEYGSSEAGPSTIDYMFKDKIITCGHPQNDTKIIIKDDNSKSLKANEDGIIHIESPSVSPGYLVEEDSEQSVFLKNEDNYVFNTNDIGHLTNDGDLIATGRANRTINLNGKRIDLYEIENTAKTIEWIDEAVCKVQKINDHDTLILFYVSNKDYDDSKIKKEILEQLPHYMLPSIFVQIKEVPLNINGKIDYEKLKFDDSDNFSNVSQDKAFIGDSQVDEICKMMKTALGVENVNPDSSFYELGGDSLTAISFLGMLQNKGYDIKFDDLYINSTPKSIYKLCPSNSIQRKNKQINSNYKNEKLFFPTTISTKFQYTETVTNDWWLREKFILDKTWTEKEFSEILSKIINNHPVFRSNFIDKDDWVLQEITDIPKANLYFYDSRNDEQHDIAFKGKEYDKLWKKIDLSNYNIEDNEVSLANFYCEKISNTQCILTIKMSHALMDGYALTNILLKEIDCDACNLIEDNFIEHMKWFWNARENDTSSIEFFKEYLSGYTQTDLRSNKLAKYVREINKKYIVKLNKHEVETIQNILHGLNISLTDFLLYQIIRSYMKVAKVDDIVVPVGYFGRYPDVTEGQNVFGNLILTIPIRMKKSMSFSEFIASLKRAYSFSYINFEALEGYTFDKWKTAPRINAQLYDNKNYKTLKKMTYEYDPLLFEQVIKYENDNLIIELNMNILRYLHTDVINIRNLIRKSIEEFIKENN